MRSLARVTSVLLRLQQLADSQALCGGTDSARLLAGAQIAVSQLHDAVSEVEEGVKRLRELEKSVACADDLGHIQGAKQELSTCLAQLSRVNVSARQSKILLFTGRMFICLEATRKC